MTPVEELEMISYRLRNIVLKRWTGSEIMEHVAIKIPAPIFDRLIMEVQAELPMVKAEVDYGITRTGRPFHVCRREV